MADDPLAGSGYAGLFVVSFLSATLLPLGSEAVVALLPALGYEPAAVLLVATVGNTLGALLNYAGGQAGARLVATRWWRRRDPGRLARARRLYARWGAPLLFLSWLPVVGDPLTAVAGAVGTPLPAFLLWVTLGKLVRYAVVLGVAGALVGAG